MTDSRPGSSLCFVKLRRRSSAASDSCKRRLPISRKVVSAASTMGGRMNSRGLGVSTKSTGPPASNESWKPLGTRSDAVPWLSMRRRSASGTESTLVTSKKSLSGSRCSIVARAPEAVLRSRSTTSSIPLGSPVELLLSWPKAAYSMSDSRSGNASHTSSTLGVLTTRRQSARSRWRKALIRAAPAR